VVAETTKHSEEKIVSNTDEVMEEESRKTRDEVVTGSSYQIRMSMVVFIERGVKENKRHGGIDSSYQIRMSMVPVVIERGPVCGPT
jgi:hypothetical protein